MDFFGDFFDEFFGDFFGEPILVLNTWPDPSKVATTETWYENGVLKTGTMTSGGARLLYVIATN